MHPDPNDSAWSQHAEHGPCCRLWKDASNSLSSLGNFGHGLLLLLLLLLLPSPPHGSFSKEWAGCLPACLPCTESTT
ncbi:hypothetical protein K431DRAFT_281006 [Polychaeton citri CBS 116435]|uniref:Uncharacterized protein n=1 Tax=Polychaeton citri CBS 116435 TaxID=1314669 RepID=A0A9P4QG58_9PEZI|nr:hypothetical protein K431DRAFT_281006 [Polychaeton citri CBS 116435]